MVMVMVCGCDVNDKGSVVSIMSIFPLSLGFLL